MSVYRQWSFARCNCQTTTYAACESCLRLSRYIAHHCRYTAQLCAKIYVCLKMHAIWFSFFFPLRKSMLSRFINEFVSIAESRVFLPARGEQSSCFSNNRVTVTQVIREDLLSLYWLPHPSWFEQRGAGVRARTLPCSRKDPSNPHDSHMHRDGAPKQLCLTQPGSQPSKT